MSFVVSLVALLLTGAAQNSYGSSPVNVLTYHNNIARTGVNSNETILAPFNVVPGVFGKLFHVPVDGYIYAEPLYASGVTIPNQGVHNVVYVATEHDSVYALDAGTGHVLWKDSLIDPANGITTVLATQVGCADIIPEIGITSTPVIDLGTHTIYTVSATYNSNTSQYAQQLHALDLSTGAEKFGGPVAISASVTGTGYPDHGDTDGHGHVIFNPETENQRAALLLFHGVVYVAFASHCDIDEYHGWVLGYDAKTLKQVGAFNATPNGSEGGIWQSGNGPAATPSGSIFVGTGNGSFNASQNNYSDSFVRLAAGTLKVLDYFTPTDEETLEGSDLDFGSTGPMLLPAQPGPTPYELIGGGKSPTLYILNRADMGHFCGSCNPPDPQAVQTVPQPAGMFSAPAHWRGFVYQASDQSPLLAFSMSGGKLSATPAAQTSVTLGFQGSTPAISSNGSMHGIVWILLNDGGGVPAVLYAFRAGSLKELYNSSDVSTDSAGLGVKFAVPTVANGQVYVGTQTELDVYGIIPP